MNLIPTQTFYNLSSEKKERIIEAAIEEFSRYYFQEAKISRIIKKAQIPRGSFYQYFSDKFDLYRFLFDYIAKKKGGYMDAALQSINEIKSTTMIREMYTAGIQFAKDYPLLAIMGSKFFRETREFKEKILGKYEKEQLRFLEELLEQGKMRKEIKEEVDTKVAAYILANMLQAVVDYVCKESKDDDVFKEDGDLLRMIEKVLFIFEHGIERDSSFI